MVGNGDVPLRVNISSAGGGQSRAFLLRAWYVPACEPTESIYQSTGIHTLGEWREVTHRKCETGSRRALLFSSAFSSVHLVLFPFPPRLGYYGVAQSAAARTRSRTETVLPRLFLILFLRLCGASRESRARFVRRQHPPTIIMARYGIRHSQTSRKGDCQPSRVLRRGNVFARSRNKNPRRAAVHLRRVSSLRRRRFFSRLVDENIRFQCVRLKRPFFFLH